MVNRSRRALRMQALSNNLVCQPFDIIGSCQKRC